jgi:DNA invertase Pin-like site-specific DNA recombinase
MKIKYNRVSTLQQTGNRFEMDQEKYDLILLDKVSGTVPFMQREKGQEVVKLVEAGKIKDLVVEELSRLGRHVGDVIQTLHWLDGKGVNVIVRNMGNLQSRPNNTKNKIFELITSLMSSLYSMELENIRERTYSGRVVYVQNGGRLGRPLGSGENERSFIEKPKSKEIIKLLNKDRTIREISKYLGVSNKTIIKTKRIGQKYGLIAAEAS